MKTPTFRLRTAGGLTLLPGLIFALLLLMPSVKSAEPATDARKQLKDPSPKVRQKAALALAQAHDAEAIPVLIDLLAELPAEQRTPVEEFLTRLAGEWAPVSHLQSDDRIARAILRDAWKAWWKNSDGAALLAVVREHTLTPERKQQIKGHIGKLGDDEFATREAAFQELLHLGRIALPQLREAASSKDLEVAPRVRDLVERIEKEPSRKLPAAAVRLLALRKPPEAAAVLLAYLPFAGEEDRADDVQNTLAVLAVRDGKLDATLVQALADESPSIRSTAAEALVKGGGKEGRDVARKLLEDKTPSVRQRAALALIPTGERDAVAVLIDLLAVVPEEDSGQIEDALAQLAGDSIPETPSGADEADRKKCRDVWAAWWKINRERVDLSRLSARAWYGYTLLCDSGRNRVYEIDRHGKERWSISGVPYPVDACVVGGKHVLIAEYSGNQISERDLKGKVIWSKATNGQPVNVQRLPNGHTFIATQQQLLEVDRGGKEVYRINNLPGAVTAAYRGRDGRIVCIARNGSQCLILDTAGKQLKQFNSNRNGAWTSGIDLLANGHILITQPNRNKVTEYDREGNEIVSVDAPQVTTATGLPNGHFLLASSQTNRVWEVDRGGKMLWEHRAGTSIFRARRR